MVNVFEIEVLKKYFPFLKDIAERLEITDISEIRIKNGDEVLLSQTGQEISREYEDGINILSYTIYFAVTKESRIIELESAIFESYPSGRQYEYNANSIDDQLFMNNIDPEYIVKCIRSESKGEEPQFALTVYKMEDFDLKKYQKKISQKSESLSKQEAYPV